MGGPLGKRRRGNSEEDLMNIGNEYEPQRRRFAGEDVIGIDEGLRNDMG
jgi:hypothetical protein